MTKNKAYIGLGSNLGKKEKNLQMALKKIASLPEVKILQVAPIYKTDPVGLLEQDWFLNTVVEVECTKDPLWLLEELLEIENKMGRVRTIHWGPRVIDLDLLAYEDIVIKSDKLTIPHPYIKDRAFVLVPLSNISPELNLPGMGRVIDLLNNVEGKEQIHSYLD